jgi:hypothetical protein
VGFEVLTAVKMKMFFGVLTPCTLVGRYQNFRETYCLNHENGDSMFLRSISIYYECAWH